MQDHEKTKDQLIAELNEMHRRVAELEAAETRALDTERVLRETEHQLKSILSASPVGIFHIRDRRIIWANHAWEELFGFGNEQEYIGQLTSIMHRSEVEWENVRSMLYDNVTQGEVSEADALLRRKDGSVFDAHIRISLLDPGNPARGTISAIVDISEKKTIEEALVKSERFLSNIFSSIPDGISVLDKDMNIIMVNQTMGRWYAHAVPFIGKKCFEVYHGASQPCQVCPTIQTLKTGESAVEVVPMTGEGGIRIGWNELYSFPLTDMSTGELTGVIEFVRDITERIRVQETFEEASAFLNTLMNAIPLPIFYKDTDGLFIGFNKAFEEFYGKTRQELIGNSVFDIYPEDLAKVYHAKDLELFHDPGVQAYGTKLQDARGNVHDVVFHKSTFSDAQGDVLGLIGVILDITERKQAEQERENLRAQLLQSQKMETMGTLAMGIAHDFNNMLTVILGYSSLLLADKNEGDQGYEELQQIEKTSQVAADLVQKIRIYGRMAEINRVPLDLNHQVDEVTKLLSHSLPNTIEMDIHLAKDPVIINADSSQITQMVMNLTINASEAMLDGGRLTIRTDNIVLDDDYCRSHIGAKQGPHVMLKVSDTGRGIDKGQMERIFDPFFTTKGRDYRKGTGLGLSVVQGIVQQHGGHITVESEVGQGTTFRIYFPVVDLEKVPEDVEREIPLPSGGTETILLVEDEESVRDLGVAILEKIGYTVLSAVNGQDALEIYEKEQESISLVILDIIMPRMDGKQCFKELLQINPTVKVLISTGIAQDALIEDVVALGAKGLVSKPYEMRQLLQAVREILDSG